MTIEAITETQKVYINVLGMRTPEQARELADELVLAAREVERNVPERNKNDSVYQELVSNRS